MCLICCISSMKLSAVFLYLQMKAIFRHYLNFENFENCVRCRFSKKSHSPKSQNTITPSTRVKEGISNQFSKCISKEVFEKFQYSNLKINSENTFS